MSLHNYLEKLRAKPVHERKRIAVVVTIIGFFIFVGIWLVSFREMNKPAETQVDPASASLNDLKDNFQDNFQTGKDSIQNMMQELPSQTSPAGEAGGATTTGTDSSVDNSANSPAPVDNNSDQNNQDKPSVPQLP